MKVVGAVEQEASTRPGRTQQQKENKQIQKREWALYLRPIAAVVWCCTRSPSLSTPHCPAEVPVTMSLHTAKLRYRQPNCPEGPRLATESCSRRVAGMGASAMQEAVGGPRLRAKLGHEAPGMYTAQIRRTMAVTSKVHYEALLHEIHKDSRVESVIKKITTTQRSISIKYTRRVF